MLPSISSIISMDLFWNADGAMGGGAATRRAIGGSA